MPSTLRANQTMRLLANLLNDPGDLIPGEQIIADQTWADVGGSGPAPEWHIIYQKEFQQIDSATDLQLRIALERFRNSRNSEWARAQPELFKAWLDRIAAIPDNDSDRDTETRRCLLRTAVADRQAFYSNLRQEVVYRGKVILLSTASLLLGILLLLAWFYCNSALSPTSTLTRPQAPALALCCGWVGGAFSWLSTNRSAIASATLASLREVSRWPYTMSRALIGAFAGVVFLAALSANIVTNPVPNLFIDQPAPDELSRARESFRVLVSPRTSDATLAAKAEQFLIQQLNARYQTAVHWTDQDWLVNSGLSTPDTVRLTTTTVAAQLHRSTDSFWMLFFLSILAGFSEKLVRSLLEVSSSRLETSSR